MTFEEYLNDAWANHPTHSTELLEGFKENISLITSSDEVTAMGQLIAHVCGEHLGEWGKGIQLIESLRRHPQLKDRTALNRFIASLALAEDENFSLESFSDSDRVRIYSMTASALASQRDIERAAIYIEKAEDICRRKLDRKDAALRSMAIAGNNLACALEERSSLTLDEIDLMIQAAFVGRKFWEMAGGWREVERAEYRLAKSFLRADILDKAYIHAEKCLEIIAANGCDPLEYFFGLEVMARIEKEKKNQLGYEEALKGMRETLAKINPEDREWCKGTLESVEDLHLLH